MVFGKKVKLKIFRFGFVKLQVQVLYVIPELAVPIADKQYKIALLWEHTRHREYQEKPDNELYQFDKVIDQR